MKRAAWEVLMVLVERRDQMVPIDKLMDALPPSKGSRYLRGDLSTALTQLRAALADTGMVIRREPARRLPITHYGLFDTTGEAHGETLRRVTDAHDGRDLNNHG